MELEATIVFEKNWEAIHSGDYKYIINEGSSRSSKTYSLIDCYDLYARQNRDKRLTVWRDTKTDCVKTILNDTLKHLKRTNRYFKNLIHNKTNQILQYDTGSTFEIHGTDDEETVHGLTQDAAWLNEPYKISKETFDQIDQRTSDFIFIDWNPKKAHWIEDLKKDKRAILIKSTFKDNPFCPPEQKAKILSYQPVKCSEVVELKLITEPEAKIYPINDNPLDFTDKQIIELSRCIENERKNSANEFNWQVYGLGLKAERPNRIFKFTEIPYQDYLNINSQIYTASDWGVVDPWGVLDAKLYDGAIYVDEKNYDSENIIKANLLPNELAQINSMEEGLIGWKFNRIGIDKNRVIVCDSNRPLKIIALRRAGFDYAIAAIKGAGSIVDGVNSLTNIPVYFTDRSTNFKYEQENYSRKVDRYGIVLEEPEDVDNHLMDCIRYIYQFLKSEGLIKTI